MLKVDVEGGAEKFVGKAPRRRVFGRVILRVDIEPPVSHLECSFDGIAGARGIDGRPAKAILNDVKSGAPLVMDARVSLGAEQRLDLGFAEILRHRNREGQQQSKITNVARALHEHYKND